MKTFLLLLLLTITFFSCQSTDTASEEKNQEATPETSADFTSLQDQLNFTTAYFLEAGSFENTSLNSIQTTFNIDLPKEKYVDSIPLENCILYRTFAFENEQLSSIKLSSYSDSAQMASILSTQEDWLKEMTTLLGEPSKSTPFSRKWNIDELSIKLKIFPEEGIDFIIAPSNQWQQTTCVGNLSDVIDEIASVLSNQPITLQNIDSLQPVYFDGITVSFQNNEMLIQYECQVSTKLMLVDSKSIISLISSEIGSKPEIKDGMQFWSAEGIKIQFSMLEQGYSIKFIN